MAVAQAASLEQIQRFLDCRRIALIGVSRQPNDYSRGIFEEFRERGYDVVPVNPAVSEIEGAPCFPDIGAVAPPVDAAIVLVGEKHLVAATRSCLDAGVKRFWFRHGEKVSVACREALELARGSGADVIANECPLMFLPHGAWFHRAHAAIARLTGHYPR